MKDLQEFYDRCAIAAMQSLIVASHTEVEQFHKSGPTSEEEFYTIPRLVEDAHRYASAMVAYAEDHPLDVLPGRVSYLTSEGVAYGTTTKRNGQV